MGQGQREVGSWTGEGVTTVKMAAVIMICSKEGLKDLDPRQHTARVLQKYVCTV